MGTIKDYMNQTRKPEGILGEMMINRQDLLRESLRVLKKGGTFAIHDIMSKAKYGDMDEFVESLRAEGYEDVNLIPTDNGLFMPKDEAQINTNDPHKADRFYL